MNLLQKPSMRRRDEFLDAVKRSKKLHIPWTYPPSTPEAFDASFRRWKKENQLAYWICTEQGDLAGVINVSEIVRGSFCSAYLGYYAFEPHTGHGFMKRGLRAVLSEVFSEHQLHRVEANIQPENFASRGLVKGIGFRLEGYSPRYLKVGGRWRDHERWAITVEEWKILERGAKT